MASQLIENKLKLLPEKAGCYLMKDVNGKVIFYADKLILLCNSIFDHFVRGKASLIAFRQKVLFSQNLTHTVIKLP